jgi:hypothetical protein
VLFSPAVWSGGGVPRTPTGTWAGADLDENLLPSLVLLENLLLASSISSCINARDKAASTVLGLCILQTIKKFFGQRKHHQYFYYELGLYALPAQIYQHIPTHHWFI